MFFKKKKEEIISGTEECYEGRSLIIELDLTGKINFVNRRVLEVLKYEKTYLIGLNIKELENDHDPRDLYKEAFRVIETGNSWYCFVRIKTSDNNYVWMEMIIQARRDNEKIIGYILTYNSTKEDQIKRVQKEYERLVLDDLTFMSSEYSGILA